MGFTLSQGNKPGHASRACPASSFWYTFETYGFCRPKKATRLPVFGTHFPSFVGNFEKFGCLGTFVKYSDLLSSIV
jgi:hypothetical protein